MRYYTVALLDVRDPRWVPFYAHEVTKLVEKAGGRYLARTGKAELVEGEAHKPSVFLIIEWPSRELAKEFYHSPEYAEFLRARLEGSEGCNWLVAGEDAAGLAKIPTASAMVRS